MNILVEAVRIFEGVATSVADQAQDGLGLYRGLDGTTAADTVTNWTAIARSLGDFLSTLHRVDPTGGPEPGPHNFFRGAPVTVYADETAAAIAALDTEIDRSAVEKVWDTAATTQWAADPQWFHGDVAADNLLTRNGQLTAVIDFGTSGIGDPACDTVIAWTDFDAVSRAAFRRALSINDDAWARGRGWALWKALITLVNQLEHNDSQGAARAPLAKLPSRCAPCATCVAHY
jgi:aminoglycoside phosphotransferase (APT) family kinase protein